MRLPDLEAAFHYASMRKQLVDARHEVEQAGIPQLTVGRLRLDDAMLAALVPVLICQLSGRIAALDDQLRQRGIIVD